MLLVLLVCGGVGFATQSYLKHYLVSQVDNRLTESMNRQVRFDGNDGPGNGTSPVDSGTCAASGSSTGGGGGKQPWARPGFDDSLGARIVNGQLTYAVVFTGPDSCTVLSDAARQTLQQAVAAATSGRPETVTLDGVGTYRFLAAADGQGTSVTGESLDQEFGTLNRLAWTLVIVIAVAVAVASVVAFLLVRRALRPLDRVASTARQVATVPLHRGEVDLGIRVPDKDTDPRTEVGQVGAALNQMLGHVSTALERRQASEMQVRQFVADASHELRTPLAAIRGYTELARRPDTEADAIAHALSRVDSESVRMSGLVDDLLLLARLDAGRPLDEQEVDLTLLVMDVVSDARAAGPEHNWRLDLPDEPVAVTGDQPRLHQVIANLLTNARTHTPPGTTVTTGIAIQGDQIDVTVSDDGPGIEKHLLPGIFDRFVRGDSSRSRAAGSTGLGLAIVRAVVNAHRGTVAVESRPGRTTFTVRLPEPGASN